MCSCFIEFVKQDEEKIKMRGTQMLDSIYHMTLNLLRLKINKQVFHSNRPLFEKRGP